MTDHFTQKLVAYQRDSRLEAMLIQWGREYGYGPADNLGYGSRNILDKLHAHAGYMPPPEPVRAPVRTEADTVEEVVRGMEQGDMWKHARILRVDYYLPNIAMSSRIERLRKQGVMVSSKGYEDYLTIAKETVRISLCITKKRA